jgi:hypothetical protein
MRPGNPPQIPEADPEKTTAQRFMMSAFSPSPPGLLSAPSEMMSKE